MADSNRVRLCAYHAMPWEMVKDVDESRIHVPFEAFKLSEIRQVHEILEDGGGGSKMVVVVTNE